MARHLLGQQVCNTFLSNKYYPTIKVLNRVFVYSEYECPAGMVYTEKTSCCVLTMMAVTTRFVSQKYKKKRWTKSNNL